MDTTIALLIVGLVFFVTLAVHEAAHAIVMKWFKIPIEEVFIGVPTVFTIRTSQFPIKFGPILLLGGVKSDDTVDDFHWMKRFLFVLAGPAVSILFGLLVMKLAAILGHGVNFSESLDTIRALRDPCESTGFVSMGKEVVTLFQLLGVGGVLWYLGWVNILMGKFNALPIPPLDGGRMVFLLLEGIFGPKIVKLFQIVSVVVILSFFGWGLYSTGAGVVDYVMNHGSESAAPDPCG